MKHLFSIAFLLAATATFAQQKITPEEASKHIGDSLQVCGKVYGGVYLEKSNGQPTILNFGAAFPNSPFTAVMFSKTRSLFPNAPEVYYNEKNVCVLGKIVEYKGKPQIVVTKAEQLSLDK